MVDMRVYMEDIFISKGYTKVLLEFKTFLILTFIEILSIEELTFKYIGPLHTWDWEPGITTLQALSLVEKAEPVQVHFTLRLRDQGVCECKMDVK